MLDPLSTHHHLGFICQRSKVSMVFIRNFTTEIFDEYKYEPRARHGPV